MNEGPNATDSSPLPSVGILGGTGPLGNGLARRWAAAGLRVAIGSRDAERATIAAKEIGGAGESVIGLSLVECAAWSDVVVVAVPWEAHAETCRQIADHVAGKIVIDVVNPLGIDKQGPFALVVDEGSAAQQAATLLTEAHVVGAFHHVSAVLLGDANAETVATDVMVLGDDRSSTDAVQALVDVIPGMRGIFGGRLRNCGQVEALTANLIAINKRYKTHAGVGITGLGPHSLKHPGFGGGCVLPFESPVA